MVARHAAFYAPLLAAIGAGFLKEAGFDARYSVMTADRTVPDALRSGDAQVGQLSVSSSWAWMEQGKANDLFHFAQINERDGFFIVGREADPAFDWHKLLGAEVLVDHFAQPLAMFQYACHEAGIDYGGIRALDAGGVEDIDRAFRAGSGQYAHLQGPAAQQLEADGVGHVVAAVGETIGPVAFSSLVATRAWLAGDAARAFTAAYRQARLWVNEAHARAVTAALTDFFPGIDPAVLTQTIARYQHLGCWYPDLEIKREHYDRALDVFLHSGVIKHRHAYEEVVVPPPA